MREKSTMPTSPSEQLVKSSWTGPHGESSIAESSALSTVLDDLSRYIIRLEAVHDESRGCDETLKRTLRASDCENTQVACRPRLLSENGASYTAADLAKWLEDAASGTS